MDVCVQTIQRKGLDEFRLFFKIKKYIYIQHKTVQYSNLEALLIIVSTESVRVRRLFVEMRPPYNIDTTGCIHVLVLVLI